MLDTSKLAGVRQLFVQLTEYHLNKRSIYTQIYVDLNLIIILVIASILLKEKGFVIAVLKTVVCCERPYSCRRSWNSSKTAYIYRQQTHDSNS
jgi:hypothetical protein